jgi:hypothetical protein
MTRESDRSYHEARVRDEIRRAEEAKDPSIAGVHRELAALHRRKMLELIQIPEPQLQPVSGPDSEIGAGA